MKRNTLAGSKLPFARSLMGHLKRLAHAGVITVSIGLPVLAPAASSISQAYGDSVEMSEVIDVIDPVQQAATAPGLAGFLDDGGHLQLPTGFSGNLNPAGFELISGKGEPPRFAPISSKAGTGDEGWTGFGGIANGCNGLVYAMAAGSVGEIYLGGVFTLCGDAPANGVVRFDPDTETWQALGSGGGNGVNGAVHALAVSGSDLYVGGFFTHANVGADVLANNIARWDGSDWQALGSGGGSGVNSQVSALVVSGTDLYAGGVFTQANVGANVLANRIARWNGNVWQAIGSGGGNGVNDHVRALAVSGDGDLFVGGSFNQVNVGAGVPANYVARWDGSAWQALGSGGGNGVNGSSFQVTSLAVSNSALGGVGGLYVAGNFTQVNVGGTLTPANRVARWDGTTWSAVGTGAGGGVNASVLAIAIEDGDFGFSMYVGGSFTFANSGGAPVQSNRVARWNGVSWSALGSEGGDGVNSLIRSMTLSDGDLYVGGDFTRVNAGSNLPPTDIGASRSARWDGSTWQAMGNGGGQGFNAEVNAVAAFGGDIYVGGGFTHVGGVAANRIARWDGSAWHAVGSGDGNGLNSTVTALAVSTSIQGDLRGLYVGGFFTEANVGGFTLPANRIARWDGATWSTVGTLSGGFNGTVLAIAIADSSFGISMYVGGEFTFANAGGIPVQSNRVARWNGVSWSALGSGIGNGVNGRVEDLVVSGNDVYVGGFFTQANVGEAVLANNIARWDGSVWQSLGSGGGNGLNSAVLALAASGGDLYVGGSFTQANVGAVVPANRIARWTGSVWQALSSGVGNGQVRALTRTDETTLFVGGAFGTAGGNLSASIARYTIPSPLRLSVLPATQLVGNTSVVSVGGGYGGGALGVQLSSGGAFCSLDGATLTALAQGECVLTATKAGDGAFPEQTASVLVRAVTISGVNLVVEFSELPPGAAQHLLSLSGRGSCQSSTFRVSVRNNGPLDASEVRAQLPLPRGLLTPLEWLCVSGSGECTPETGLAAVDTRFALNIGARAEIDVSACTDPTASFAYFQFQATLPVGTLLFPSEAQGNFSTPLNGIGVFQNGFE